jgi:OOP family OmpA-OmpF porin
MYIRLTLILLVVAFSAAAQGQEDDWYVVPSIIWFDDDSDRALDDSFPGAQVTVGRNLTEYLSLEGLLGYSSIKGYCEPGDCYPDQTHLDISANLLAFYDRDATFAPYVMLGVGYLGKDADEGPQYVRNGGTDNRPTASLGLGFKWRMGDSKYSIHGEYRGRRAYRSESALDDRLITIGVQYNFGGSNGNQRLSVRAEDMKTDTDGDGVLDIWDACPNTEAGVTVTSRGCEITNIDRDDDEDRINNSVDQCPNTPIGVPVDPRGCSLDSDMDGVTTDKDRCPASRPGADVDIYGCESDQDQDGVLDQYDNCPNTPAGARTDVAGCEIKDIISLPGVNFETGQDILMPGTEYLLRTAADTLNKHPELQIEVAGHSDDVGNDDLNIGLSMRRAKTVQDFLIRYGVDEDRLTFKGYGESQPIADNSTAEGRATNRRVELRLVTR